MALQPIVTALCMLSMLNGQGGYVSGQISTSMTLADITASVSEYNETEMFQFNSIINNISNKQDNGNSITEIVKQVKTSQSNAQSQPKADITLLVKQAKANATTEVVDSITQQEDSAIRKEEQSQMEQIKADNTTASTSQIDALKAKQEKEYAEKQAYIQQQKDELAKQETVRKVQTENDPGMDYSDYYIETSLNQEEYDMICAVVQAEAGGGTMEFREYVAGVIYNRVHSPYYPNTVYDVLHSPNQFTTISNYEQNYAPIDDTTRQAVSRVFDGIDLYILYNLQYASAYCNPYTSSAAGFAWFKKLNCVFEARYPANDPNTRWVHWFYTV